MNLENLKFVGMDLSLTGTGLVCINGNSKVIASKLIQTKPTKDKLKRFLSIRNNIRVFLTNLNIKDVIDIPEYNYPTEIVIEGFSYGSKGASVYDLGMLGGIIRLDLFEKSFPYYVDYPPTFVKKFITGKGNAKKDLMIKEVFKLGFDTDDSNLADAFALAYIAKTIYLVKNKIDQKLNKNQKILIEKYLFEKSKEELSKNENTNTE